MYFHSATLLITIMMLATLLVHANISDAMEKNLCSAFKKGYVMIGICAILDWFRIAMNGAMGVSTFMHFLVVSLEYSLAPFITLLLIGVLGGMERNRWLIPLFIFNIFFQLTSYFTHASFYINSSNFFVFGDYFRVYVAIYALGIVLMYKEVFMCSKQYQNCSSILLVLNLISLTLGIGINEYFGDLHTTFLAVAIASVMFYLYFMEMSIQTDGLTKLLNYRCYNSHLKKINYATAVVMFDINKFKQVNDTYGHEKGDIVLKLVASALRSALGTYGYIYRLGGDEFCLILDKGMLRHTDFDDMRNRLDILLAEMRKKEPVLPSISMGYAVYDGENGAALKEIIAEADRKMYANKNGSMPF